MSVNISDLAEKLREPFPAGDVEWRIGQAKFNGGRPWAMVLAYLTNRAIQSRLDDVVGAGNWCNHYQPGPSGGVLCGIEIHGVTKWDGAENTQIESVKGGLSDSMKRAAVQWGMGRYLYNLPSGFAECSATKKTGDDWRKHYDSKEGKAFWWRIPSLPVDFLPQGDETKPRAEGEPAVDEPDAKAQGDEFPGTMAWPECKAKMEGAKSWGEVDALAKAHKARAIAEGWDRDLAGMWEIRKAEFNG